MLWAFSRLFLIAFFAVFTMVFAAFSLRQAGLHQSYKQFHHPLVSDSPWLIAKGGDLDQGPAQSASALSAALKLSSDIFLGLHIRQSRDGGWILYAPRDLSELTTGQGFVSQYPTDDLKKLRFQNSEEPLLTLHEAFSLFPKAKFYIDVLQPAATGLNSLFDMIKKFGAEERVVLSSPYMSTLTALRQQSSLWLTGASTSELAKAQFMSSLFLEPLTELNGEVFLTKKFNDRLFSELFRRKKIVLIEENNASRLSLWRESHPKLGIVTTRPSYFRQMVDTNSNSH